MSMVRRNPVVGSTTFPGESVTAEMENPLATSTVKAVRAQAMAKARKVVFMALKVLLKMCHGRIGYIWQGSFCALAEKLQNRVLLELGSFGLESS